MPFLTIFLTLALCLVSVKSEARTRGAMRTATFQLVKAELWVSGVEVDLERERLRSRLGERLDQRQVPGAAPQMPDIPELPLVVAQQPEELTRPLRRFLGR